MSWLLYSLAAMALLGASALAARALSKYELGFGMLSNPQAVGIGAAFVLLSLAGSFFYFLAMREPGSKTAVVAGIVALNVALIAVVSFLLFGENLSMLQMGGLALAVVSVVLLSAG
jgi:uncharacterized membrane protein